MSALAAPRPFVQRGRAAILRFRLPRRALVVFEVRALAPVCRPAGLFRVNGRAGLNRVRFAGRVAGRRLPPGTYELHARGYPGVRARVVVLPRGVAVSTAGSRLRASACAAASTGASIPVAVSTPPSTAAPTATPAAGEPAGAQPEGGVAGVRDDADEPAPSSGDPGEDERDAVGPLLDPFGAGDGALGTLVLALLLAGVGAAMLMLVAAAVPERAARAPVVAGLVADRRLELTLAGTATLLAVTIAYLLAVA